MTPTTKHQQEVVKEIIGFIVEWKGVQVEVLDLSDDKERAYVTAVNNEPIGGKAFVRHVGWCDRTSAFAPVAELVVAQTK